jgi:Leucine-rich repeat (LRR) protein
MGNKVTPLSTEISLNNKNLNEIPSNKQLQDFLQLKTILLNHNSITVIPPSVSKQIQETPKFCDNLHSLELSHNKLTELPKAICLLVNLKKLRLDHNKLIKLPSGFSALFVLEKLTLDHNLLIKLPANMGNMKKLKVLRLDTNALRYIPNDIGTISTLKELTIHDNPLPQELLELADLDSVMMFIANQKVPENYKKEMRNLQSAKQKFDAKEDIQGQKTAVFRKLLADVKARASFKTFLQAEFSHENLDFWEAVEEFRKTYNSDVEVQTKNLIRDAEAIYKGFIDDKSDKSVNLAADVKEKIQKIFTDDFNYPKGINQWSFNEAHNKIFILMYTDKFLRFAQTEDGKRVIALFEEK